MRRAFLASLATLWLCSAAGAGGLPQLDMSLAAPVGESVISGSQPTRADLAKLRDAGVRAVVDLRDPSEDRGFDEAAVAKELGLVYVSLPVSGAAGVTAENAAKLDEILREQSGKTLVHCASGNRAGALLALRAAASGQGADEAILLGRQAGLTGLESTVRARLAAGSQEDGAKESR